MISVPQFMLALTVLLVVPGPTNTLLAASGATVGVTRSLKLLPAELVGFLLAMEVWSHLILPLEAFYRFLPAVMKLLAAAYLLWSAVKFWRKAPPQTTATSAPVSAGRVFVTALLNPKALIFVVAIFPPGDVIFRPLYPILFSAIVAAIGCGWVLVGASILRSRPGGATPVLVSRIAAVALGVFAILLTGSVIGR